MARGWAGIVCFKADHCPSPKNATMLWIRDWIFQAWAFLVGFFFWWKEGEREAKLHWLYFFWHAACVMWPPLTGTEGRGRKRDFPIAGPPQKRRKKGLHASRQKFGAKFSRTVCNISLSDHNWSFFFLTLACSLQKKETVFFPLLNIRLNLDGSGAGPNTMFPWVVPKFGKQMKKTRKS